MVLVIMVRIRAQTDFTNSSVRLVLLTAGAGAKRPDAELHERAGNSPPRPKALKMEAEFERQQLD